jgi:hypothetical protein
MLSHQSQVPGNLGLTARGTLPQPMSIPGFPDLGPQSQRSGLPRGPSSPRSARPPGAPWSHTMQEAIELSQNLRLPEYSDTSPVATLRGMLDAQR